MWERKVMDKILRASLITGLLACFYSFTVFGAGVSAQAVYENPDTGYRAYIMDGEDLLTDDEESELLEGYMKGITEYGGVAFVSTSSSDGEQTAKDICYDLFDNDSGTVLCVDMGDRRISIMSSGAIYKRINKSYGYTITDNVYKYASDKDYMGCASKAFYQEYVLLEGGHIAQPMKYISNFFMAIVLALFCNFLYVWISRGKVHVDSEALLILAAGAAGTGAGVAAKNLVKQRKSRHVSSSGGSSGGGYHGGGGHHGGGGFHGGGGSHRF